VWRAVRGGSRIRLTLKIAALFAVAWSMRACCGMKPFPLKENMPQKRKIRKARRQHGGAGGSRAAATAGPRATCGVTTHPRAIPRFVLWHAHRRMNSAKELVQPVVAQLRSRQGQHVPFKARRNGHAATAIGSRSARHPHSTTSTPEASGKCQQCHRCAGSSVHVPWARLTVCGRAWPPTSGQRSDEHSQMVIGQSYASKPLTATRWLFE
jgi:hypothetical protein